jgi:spermidine synthase
VPARLPELPSGDVLLDAAESTYQSVRVVERNEAGTRVRFLQVNESFDSYQSVWAEREGWLGPGYYYDFFAYPLWWSRDVRDWRVGVVGLGGGTAWRVLHGARPEGVELHMTGAEIDPAVVELARAWMNLEDAGGRCRALAGLDGRALVESTHSGFELLILDAYANQTEIPPHLASVEFLRACKTSLAPRGWLVTNVGGFGFDDPVVRAVGETLATAFDARVLALGVPFSRNVAIFARRDAAPCAPGSAEWATGDADVDRRLSAVAIPGNQHWYDPQPEPRLTDDRNAIQQLQRQSIERAARRGGP